MGESKMVSNTTKAPRESKVRQKSKRIPPGQPRMKLTVDGLPKGKRGYWADESMIQELLDGGYSFVDTKGQDIEIGSLGDGNQDLGSLVSRQSGDKKIYLMAIPEEWYQENQAEKQKALEAVDEQIRNPKGQHLYKPGNTGIEIEEIK